MKRGIIAVALILTGCAVGPNYQRPDVTVPASFSNAIETKEQGIDHRKWWTAFNDQMLNFLVDEAVKSNRDIRLAEARIKEARALYGVADAALWPALQASGSYSRNRTSENAPQSKRSGIPEGSTYSLFQAGFDASWEIDIFGGVRRSVEAAEADIEAAVEESHAVLISILGEVAKNYIEMRGLQKQLAVTEENARSQQETLDLINARFKAGLVSFLDVTRAESLLTSTKSQIPPIERAIKQAAHRLSVLLSKDPSALWPELSKRSAIPVPASGIASGLPSELLQRRPDIRKAERELAAASARIGVAKADLFPRFSLTGSLGLQGSEVKDMDNWGSRFWTIGPSIRLPIFSGGRIKANIQVQDARYEQALIRYEQAIITALEDVENALVAYVKEEERRKALAASAASSRQALALATELYTKGLADYLNVLDAERSLLSAEGQLAQSESAVSGYIVALYKALGGGWTQE
ncbi:MAG: efflux transporter outer membrane subunit [Thermodesulfovibrionales bacterium]|nr:efflux transporter outer membrane subunit [Thermodesulfovibrionales bacterium]